MIQITYWKEFLLIGRPAIMTQTVLPRRTNWFWMQTISFRFKALHLIIVCISWIDQHDSFPCQSMEENLYRQTSLWKKARKQFQGNCVDSSMNQISSASLQRFQKKKFSDTQFVVYIIQLPNLALKKICKQFQMVFQHYPDLGLKTETYD